MNRFRLEPLHRGHRAAFERVFSRCGADADNCRCTAYWTSDWETRGRAHREAMFDHGPSDGYLLFDGDEPAGWCQCAAIADGLRLRVPEPKRDDDRAITCLLLRPEYRGRGLCTRFLKLVLDEQSRRGSGRVFVVGHRPEAYDDPGAFFELPAAACERIGLELARDDDVCPLYVRAPQP